MEDEIDLREYIAVLLRHWRLIVGLTVVAALVAGLVSFIIPPTYEATAVISTTATGIPALASSDAVLEDAIASLGSTLPASLASPAALRPLLTASQQANTTTIKLTVKDGDPARAAAIANAWANAFVTWLSSSTKTDSVPVLQAELDARISLLTNVSVSRYALEWAIEDAQSLRDRLATRSPNSPAIVEDRVLLISLSLQAVTAPNLPVSLSSQVVTAPTPPVQLQITGSSETTVGDQLKYLDDLVVSFEARRQILQRRAESLQNDIHDMQERLNNVPAFIGAPVSAKVVQGAQSPGAPTSPKKAQNAALAATLGLMVGIFAAFGWEWWKGGMRNAESPKGAEAAEKIGRE